MGDTLFYISLWFHKLLLEAQLLDHFWFFSDTLFSFSKDAFYYSYATNYTFIFTLKLAICLVFLSAIKGGVPRYRYDFLTKMGWVKFLGLVLATFLASFVIFLVW